MNELPKILGFLYNISATTEPIEFKFGAQLGLLWTIIKSHAQEKGAWPWTRGGSRSIFTQWLKLATSNLVNSLGLPRPITKSHPMGKSGCGLGLGELPKIWGFLCISATAEASNVKFGLQLGFAKAIIKPYPEEKVSMALG